MNGIALATINIQQNKTLEYDTGKSSTVIINWRPAGHIWPTEPSNQGCDWISKINIE